MLGEKITIQEGKLNVPSQPIIPFIEGDGIGPDIWASAVRVIDAAVEKAYHGQRKIIWKEVYAGEKANEKTGNFLPEETLVALKEHLVSIKGPLTTPVGGGFRSLNVALRQKLDLFACVRPVRWFDGVPSPVKKPENVDMVIFRENTEDIYAGIEYNHGSQEVEQVKDFLINEMGVSEIRFPHTASIGIKPVSKEGTERLIHAAMDYTIAKGRKSLTIVHKGNIMKFTEGMFKKWGYDYLEANFGDKVWTWQQYDSVKENEGTVAAEAAQKAALDGGAVLVKDSIADAFLQQILLRPLEYDVIATLNLNGDYISDALAAMVGGIGIAPGANINYTTGVSLFEATHGTAPKYKGLDKVNPSSVILSAVMMLDYMGWSEAGDIIEKGIEGAIANKRVTYDFERLMEGATTLKCSEFGTEIIDNMPTPIAFENESDFVTPESQSQISISESNDDNTDSYNNISAESQETIFESNEVGVESQTSFESSEESVELQETVFEANEEFTPSQETNFESSDVIAESQETNFESSEISNTNYNSTSESNEVSTESNESNSVTSHVVSTILNESTPTVHDSGEVSNEVSTESHNLTSETYDADPVTYDSSIQSNEAPVESHNVTSHEERPETQDLTPESNDGNILLDNLIAKSEDKPSDLHDATTEVEDANDVLND